MKNLGRNRWLLLLAVIAALNIMVVWAGASTEMRKKPAPASTPGSGHDQDTVHESEMTGTHDQAADDGAHGAETEGAPKEGGHGGEELRRIDTGTVLEPTDIKAVGAEAGHEAEEENEHGAAPAAEQGGHEEEAHHPAWMIPGWQTIFSALAVLYFGLMVTVLPKFVAKEEHH